MENTINYKDELYPFETKYSFEKKPNGLIVIDRPTENNCYTVKFLAHGPGFELVANLLEECTYINHITGKPFVVSSLLYRKIFTSAIVQVDFPDNNLLPGFKVDQADMTTQNYNMIKIICKYWFKEVL